MKAPLEAVDDLLKDVELGGWQQYGDLFVCDLALHWTVPVVSANATLLDGVDARVERLALVTGATAVVDLRDLTDEDEVDMPLELRECLDQARRVIRDFLIEVLVHRGCIETLDGGATEAFTVVGLPETGPKG